MWVNYLPGKPGCATLRSVHEAADTIKTWLPPGEMMGGILPWEWAGGVSPEGEGSMVAFADDLPEGKSHAVAGSPLCFAGFRETPFCGMFHSGRAAWECILLGEVRRRESQGLPPLRRVLVPRFTCATVWEPLGRIGLPGVPYGVALSLEPLLPEDAGEDDVLLLTDYFGVSGEMVMRVASSFPGLVVVDATMALFSRYGGMRLPAAKWASFYSLRKFAGVPDGGVAVASFEIPLPEAVASSEHRVEPLLRRRDGGAWAALAAGEAAEAELSAPASRMSRLTRRLVQQVDWESIDARRRENYAQLHAALGPINRLTLPETLPHGPFCYPLLSGIPGLRDDLIDRGVALPLLWPEVIENCPAESSENELARSLLPLPLDHRYSSKEMDWLIHLILG